MTACSKFGFIKTAEVCVDIGGGYEMEIFCRKLKNLSCIIKCKQLLFYYVSGLLMVKIYIKYANRE